MGDEQSFDDLPSLMSALAVAGNDPELARARAAIEARVLGVPLVPTRIGRFVVLERIGAGGMGVVYAAFDAELDRKVAIKLLFQRPGDADERARLVREARAMAKLAHPNVVHVYEVGEHDGQVFVAMEYVRGRTLRAWWSAEQRSWRERLAVCIDAGRGLAAAHARGIVHRDFKPDNVMVGDDGRARVLDFGLARGDQEPTLPDAATTSPPLRIAAGATSPTAGTPAYMAPEQLRGERADASSDQFAYSATVWEALTGALPFRTGRISAALIDASAPDLLVPARESMPRWVQRVLQRGLAEHDRFESLDRLLDALERDPTRVWVRRLAVVAVVLGMGGAFLVGAMSGRDQEVEDPCSGGAAMLDDAWPLAGREAAFDRIAGLGDGLGESIAARSREATEDYATRWTAGHREACLAHRRGEQSADLLDRRMTCLHRGRAAMATLGEVVADLDVADLPRLRMVVGSLPDPDHCSDLGALAITIDPPPPSARAIYERLAQASVLGEAGKVEDALAAIDAVVADARALDFGPLRAESLLTQGTIRINATDRTAAVASLREAVDIAMATGADETAVEAWGQLEWAWATGSDDARAQPLEGRALMLRLAERRPFSLSTLTLYNNLAGATVDPVTARELYQRAADGSKHLGLAAARVRATALLNLGRLAPETPERERINAEAVALWIAIAGPEHPRTIGAREMQAVGRIDIHAAAEQLDGVCIDVARFQANIPGEIASCERQRALLHEIAGNTAAVDAATRRWVEHAGGIEDADDAFPRGMAALRYGDAVEAAAILTTVVTRYEAMPARQWWENLEMGEAELALGRALRRLGRDDADAMLERALRRLVGDGSEARPPVAQRQIQLARALIDRTLPSAAGG